MMRSLRNSSLVALLILLSMPVLAEDANEADAKPDAVVTEESTDAVLELDAFNDSATLSDEELGSQRAREGIDIDTITIIGQEQDGEVSDNVAIGNTNGDNLINGEAFSNSSGFLSTVQNTGNNVLIQNSTIINVAVETPGD